MSDVKENKNQGGNEGIVMVAPETDAHLEGIEALRALAFAEKTGCCDPRSAQERAKSSCCYETYKKKYPEKLKHCRILKNNKENVVMAACQLMLPGDPGDLGMPEFMRHALRENEIYLEWIACHPEHTGKGLGSKLLKWAVEFAAQHANTSSSGKPILTLEVMKSNAGATRLYERKGFVIRRDPRIQDECDECITSCLVFCCMGCRYCSYLYMEKELSPEEQHLGGGGGGGTTAPMDGMPMAPQTQEIERLDEVSPGHINHA